MKKNIIIYIIIALLFFCLGFLANFYYQGKNKNISVDTGNTYKAGWDAAKKRLVDTGFLQTSETNAAIKSVTGKISSVDNGIIKIKIVPLEPLADPSLDTREIDISQSTKLFQIIEKDKNDYQKEVDDYIKKTANTVVDENQQDLMPIKYKTVTAQKSSFIVGQTIAVVADSDIKNEKNIKAAEVTIQPDVKR